jgi:hypothetical protein
MTDDILKEASRALYATTQGADESARFTRARVLASVHQQRRRRTTKAIMFGPLAAILLGGSAWAASGGQLPQVVYQMAEIVGITPPAPEAPAPPQQVVGAGRGAPGAVNPTALDPSEIEGAAPEPEPEPEPEPVEVPEEPESPAAKAPASRAKVVTPAPPVDAEGTRGYELFRKAHRLHFEQHDAAAALVAWNEYLAEAPGGRFALEASYNRGICLVRLGRASEALRVLEPFADGLYGGYRQSEATELVKALKGEEADAGAE